MNFEKIQQLTDSIHRTVDAINEQCHAGSSTQQPEQQFAAGPQPNRPWPFPMQNDFATFNGPYGGGFPRPATPWWTAQQQWWNNFQQTRNYYPTWKNSFPFQQWTSPTSWTSMPSPRSTTPYWWNNYPSSQFNHPQWGFGFQYPQMYYNQGWNNYQFPQQYYNQGWNNHPFPQTYYNQPWNNYPFPQTFATQWGPANQYPWSNLTQSPGNWWMMQTPEFATFPRSDFGYAPYFGGSYTPMFSQQMMNGWYPPSPPNPTQPTPEPTKNPFVLHGPWGGPNSFDYGSLNQNTMNYQPPMPNCWETFDIPLAA